MWYLFSRRILPALHITPRFISRSVLKELFRFGASFQLVSMLELLYAAVLPVTILKFFGADAAHFCACSQIGKRCDPHSGVLSSGYSFGGSLVYASSSLDQTNAFVVKAIKAMSIISIIPLGFIALYGTKIAWVWTGKTDPLLAGTICLLCASSICRSMSSLFRVLYRVSGGAVMDNAQLLLGLAVAFILSPFGPRIGFFAMVAGVSVLGQFLGLVLMCLTMRSRYKGFSLAALAPNLARFCVATAVILGVSLAASYLDLPWNINARVLETIRLLIATLISLLVAGPALLLTGSLSGSEMRMMFSTLWRRSASAA